MEPSTTKYSNIVFGHLNSVVECHIYIFKLKSLVTLFERIVRIPKPTQKIFHMLGYKDRRGAG